MMPSRFLTPHSRIGTKANGDGSDIPCESVVCALCDGNEADPVASGYDHLYRTSRRTYVFVRCRICGHVYLNPRPAAEHIHRIYPANYYTLAGRHAPSSSRLTAAFKRRVIRRRMAPFSRILKGKSRVLEIGAGDGSLLLDLKRLYPHLDITGIDMAFPAAARMECGRHGIRLVEKRVEDAVLPPEAFDLVIMNQLLEHLPDPGLVIAGIRGVLKPGGMIGIETPDLDGYDRRLFAASAWGGYYFPRHFHLFSRDTLARLLESRGFGDVRCLSLTAPLIWVYSMRACLRPSPDPGTVRAVVSRIFSDRNPLALAMFTMLDLAALAMNRRTSNMKIVARKT